MSQLVLIQHCMFCGDRKIIYFVYHPLIWLNFKVQRMESFKLCLNRLTWLKQSLLGLREKFLRYREGALICLLCVEARINSLIALVLGSEGSFILRPSGLFVRTSLCPWCKPLPLPTTIPLHIAMSSLPTSHPAR